MGKKLKWTLTHTPHDEIIPTPEQEKAIVEDITKKIQEREAEKKPDAAGKVLVLLERAPTCFWHENCTATSPPPPMMVIRDESTYTVLECGACHLRARFPVGGSVYEWCEREQGD